MSWIAGLETIKHTHAHARTHAHFFVQFFDFRAAATTAAWQRRQEMKSAWRHSYYFRSARQVFWQPWVAAARIEFVMAEMSATTSLYTVVPKTESLRQFIRLSLVWKIPQGNPIGMGVVWHFVWLARSPGSIYHWTFVRHRHYQRSKTCSRHIIFFLTFLLHWLTVSRVRAANIVQHLL